MWGSTHSCMFLGFFAFRQVSMKVRWWLASTINEDLSFLYLSSKKLSSVGFMVWFVVVISSSSNFSISLVPSWGSLFQLNPICPLDFLCAVWFPPRGSHPIWTAVCFLCSYSLVQVCLISVWAPDFVAEFVDRESWSLSSSPIGSVLILNGLILFSGCVPLVGKLASSCSCV